MPGILTAAPLLGAIGEVSQAASPMVSLSSLWDQFSANPEYAWIGAGAAAALLVLVAAGLTLVRRRESLPNLGAPSRESDASPFEQVLAELQGIRLRIRGGEGRGSLPKVSRLIRIFMIRAGVAEAEALPAADLGTALRPLGFTGEEVASLSSILEKCERGIRDDAIKLDFDPSELVEQFRSLVFEVEARLAA